MKDEFLRLLLFSLGALLIPLWVLLVAPQSASATVIIVAQEVGSDVMFHLSGSVDLAGSFLQSPSNRTNGAIIPRSADMGLYDNGSFFFDFYAFVGTPASPFGTGGLTRVTSLVGDPFFVERRTGNQVGIGVSRSYTSGDPLDSLSTFADSSFESLGVDVGTFTWTLPNDSVILVVVPEPTTVLLVGAGLVGMSWRRKENS